MEINVDTNNALRVKTFFSTYRIGNKIKCADFTSKAYIKGDSKRCRFCKGESPTVTFKKDAHVIPQLLGNKYILSNFECDDCNDLFSKHEDSLASFLGAFRTFAQISGQKGKGVPKHKNYQTGLEIYEENTELKAKIFESSLGKEIVLDQENKIISINSIKQTYVPIDVYRAILKIALCLVSEDEITDYDLAFEFLLKDIDSFTQKEFPLARLISYFVPLEFAEQPFAILFEKVPDKKDEPILTHTFALAFPNHLYQIFLPYHKNDLRMYGKDIEMKFPIIPLLVDQGLLSKVGNYKFRIFDLSTLEKRKSEPDRHTFNFKQMKIKNTAKEDNS